MRNSGFTLIEFLLVSALILVFVALSTPLFRNTFHDLELRNEAYNISKLIKYAQDSAIAEEAIYKIALSLDDNSYRLFRKTDQDSEEVFQPISGRLGDEFTLPKGASFKGEAKEIIFFPNGRSNKASIHIEDSRGNSFEIKSTGKAGLTEVISLKNR